MPADRRSAGLRPSAVGRRAVSLGRARRRPKSAVGVILTGMGKDGAEGMLELRQAGAATLGQDEESSLIYGMPRAAFERGAVMRQYRADADGRRDPRCLRRIRRIAAADRASTPPEWLEPILEKADRSHADRQRQRATETARGARSHRGRGVSRHAATASARRRRAPSRRIGRRDVDAALRPDPPAPRCGTTSQISIEQPSSRIRQRIRGPRSRLGRTVDAPSPEAEHCEPDRTADAEAQAQDDASRFQP